MKILNSSLSKNVVLEIQEIKAGDYISGLLWTLDDHDMASHVVCAKCVYLDDTKSETLFYLLFAAKNSNLTFIEKYNIHQEMLRVFFEDPSWYLQKFKDSSIDNVSIVIEFVLPFFDQDIIISFDKNESIDYLSDG